MSSARPLDDPDDIRRVRHGLLLFACAVVGAVVVTAPNLPPLPVAVLLVAGALGLVARFRVQHSLESTVFWFAASMLAVTVPGTYLRDAGPLVIAGPICIVALALPYVRGQQLTLLCVFGALATTFDLIIAETVARPPMATGLLTPVQQRITLATLFTTVILLLLRSFSRRLHELRSNDLRKAIALRELNALLESVVTSSPVAIAVSDMRGVVQRWNPSCEALFQLSAEQAVGHSLQELVEAEPAIGSLIERLASGEHIDLAEMGIASAGGAQRTVEAAAAPLCREGETVGFVLLAVDVSLRKKFEDGFMRAQQMEAAVFLAGGIAHDINNLLMVMSAEASMLRTVSLPSERDASIQAVEEAALRAGKLCHRLTAAGRQEPPSRKAVELRELIDELTPLLQRLLGVINSLEIMITDRPCPVRIGRSQFEQIMMNLAVNARDAMPHGGMFRIILERDDKDAIIKVQDTGAGMSDEVRRHAFEPYFTTKDRDGGTGLGLATIAQVVEAAGGAIALESAPGAGTAFTIRLPCSSTQAPVPPLSARDAQPVLR